MMQRKLAGLQDQVHRLAFIHIGDGLAHLMPQLQSLTPRIALQGNTPRLSHPERAGRRYQELAGVPGMTDFLASWGYVEIQTYAPWSWRKPVVIGTNPSFRLSARS